VALFEKEQVLKDGGSVNETLRLFKDNCLVEWRADFESRSASKTVKKHAAPELSEEARCYLVPSKFCEAMGLTVNAV
jgi:hypothetical protein